MARLTAEKNIVNLIESADVGSAGVDSDSFTMAYAAHATILLNFGALTGNSILKVYEGASAGTKTTAKTFRYKLAGADKGSAGADVWGAEATSAALTLTATTYDHRLLAIDIAAEDLTDGTPWVTVEIDSTATVMNVAGIAILDGLRYGAGQSSIGS